MKYTLLSICLIALISSQTVYTTIDTLTIQSTTTISNNQSTHHENNTSSLQVMNCPILKTWTNNQFDLVQCSYHLNVTNLSINMTYKVINDAKGAKANKIEHWAKYVPTGNLTNEHNETIKQVNHHLGQLIYSKISISLTKFAYPKQGDYLWFSHICYYHCTPNPYTRIPECGCDLGYFTHITFSIKRSQFVMTEIKSQQIRSQQIRSQ